MKHARRPLASVDEPNAFRISRPPPSTDPGSRHEPTTPPLITNQDYFSEPASWLRIGDLTSPLFNPHDFLQRALSDRFDKSARPSQLPLLDDAFDADAALAALDTVDSALRRMRDASRSEEAAARDELRNALHLAAKKRQSLLAAADTVNAQVASFGQVGNTAASALTNGLKSLEKHSSLLSELQDARDMLSLLILDSSALDAVRVSMLLSRARAMFDAGSLTTLLSAGDVDVARQELNKYREDLAKSVFEWMRSAVDSCNLQVIRDCAVAASHLDVEEEFIREYVVSAFKFNDPDRDKHRKSESETVVDAFRHTTWEILSVIKEVIPTISESFAAPSKPLASLLHMLIEEHILAIANDKMNLLRNTMRQAGVTPEEKNAPSGISSRRNSGALLKNSVDQSRNSTVAPTMPSIQSRKPLPEDIFAAQEHFLIGFADILRAITKVNGELFDMCRIPGTTDTEHVFLKLPDPYCKFLSPLVAEYLETERAWIDDRLGASFFEITRIESHTPRLAPRKRSDPEVYHRYRTFYSHIASNFVDMTKQAVTCAEKSLARTLDILRSLLVLVGRPEYHAGEKNETEAKRFSLQKSSSDDPDSNISDGPYRPITVPLKSVSSSTVQKQAPPLTTWAEETQARLQAIIYEVLGCVVMSYLANAETILQAATHLLPVCEEDAKTSELWMSGTSPLAAYAHAIDVLSQANMIVDDFLRNFSETDTLEDAFGHLTHAERKRKTPVLPETLEDLQTELNSGLTDLGTEAQIGVRGAVSSFRIRLGAILENQSAMSTYTNGSHVSSPDQNSLEVDSRTRSGFHVEPTPVFVSAATFLEQQLQSVVTTVKGGNRDFILTELALVTREAVLDCWCLCRGPISTSGALQLISDAKAVSRVFRNRGQCTDELECLSGIGQLFMEGPESLWSCVEAKSLAHVQGSRIVTLLKKRVDSTIPSILKVCQSLGASRQ